MFAVKFASIKKQSKIYNRLKALKIDDVRVDENDDYDNFDRLNIFTS